MRSPGPSLNGSDRPILDDARDVVRYFKNERLGFSITYYENNRPRQYYPDFIILVREPDGQDVWWLAETKGEIRASTFLKREAAELWCDRMSRSGHSIWRHGWQYANRKWSVRRHRERCQQLQ